MRKAKLRLQLGFYDCQESGSPKGFGGKDSVKENRQGCLSRSNKPFFKLTNKFEKRRQLGKKFLPS